MRPVTLADLEVALRAVLARPHGLRLPLAQKLFSVARMAGEDGRKKDGKSPQLGADTLMAAAMQHPLAPRPASFGAEEIAVFVVLLNELSKTLSHQEN